MAAVSLVDIGALDLAAGEALSGFDDGAQRVTMPLLRRKELQRIYAYRC